MRRRWPGHARPASALSISTICWRRRWRAWAIAPRLVIEGDLQSGRLVAAWGFVDTDARLCLLLGRGTSHQSGEQLAAWLRHELTAPA